MKRLLSVLLLAQSVICHAQYMGTKADSATTSVQGAPGIGVMPLFQMLIALGIVLVLLKFGLPKIAGKLNKKLVTNINGGIKIEESANFAGGSLYVVSARSKTLLLSVAQSGVTCLADLTDNTTKPTEAPVFMEILDVAKQNPDLPSFAAVEVPQEDPVPPRTGLSEDEIQAALKRLQRLGAG